MFHIGTVESEMSKSKQLKQYLLDLNRSQSQIYCSPDAEWSRIQYRIAHPTEIVACKCMDGRINLPVTTGVPMGIIQPYRTIGGQFDLGEKRFGSLIHDWVKYSVNKQRDCVVLVTYHWSKGELHRGCKGFDYDVDRARAFSLYLKKQFERVFGPGHAVVYPIQVGVETDLDALVFHGANGKDLLDLSTLDQHISEAKVSQMVRDLYPDMKEQVLKDLMQVIMGNIQHIAETRKANRPVEEIDHREQVLGLGRGFSWLHLPNKALLIGPYSYDLGDPIAVAGNLILKTLKGDKAMMGQGAVFLVSAPYRGDTATERLIAIESADSLAKFGAKVIRDKVPELIEHLNFLVGTLNEKTLLFTPNETGVNYLG
ncbi:MAG: hypothetical protein HY226_03760 [Candidatus Vogelbacteria bacterium]|nr:hypothetical protein [Candidatus Vogelbacteria bacterium]